MIKEWQLYWFSPLQILNRPEKAAESLSVNSQYQLRQIPILPVVGNHDGEVFRNAYGLDQTFASYSIGPLYFVIIDGASQDAQQRDWLSQELSSEGWKSAEFRIVISHIPPYMEYWEAGAWERGEKNWNGLKRS